jgi:hypothetical protein
MHIALFHERFIFRFGVDRVLLCLAKQFVKQGHTVTLVGQKFDNEWSLGKSVNIIKLPEHSIIVICIFLPIKELLEI